MRILFVITPGVGHAFPLVPLAWAFRGAGHDVLVATGRTRPTWSSSGQTIAVTNAGLPVVDISPEFDQPGFWQPIIAQLARDNPELAEQIAGMRGGKINDLRLAAAFLSKMSGFLADGALEVAHEWEPDLVVQSQGQGAGLVVAAKLGIPVVEHGLGFARSTGMHELHRQHMADVFDRHGVLELPEHRVILDVAPPSMLAEGTEGWPMQYVPYNGGGVLPKWLATRPERSRVAVTLGTVAFGGDSVSALERIINAAAGVDAEFVLATGDGDISALGTLPDNVRAAGWLALNALLPSCSALIHHGGSGTTVTALEA
ncbi:MAG TPA: nucleotide disphospho-sugar-binding domain-containing protein, partial [Pseudonocardiaceae bacterium]